ncbi:uncharacterized protein LOC144345475, partial [Saccoglossus kowalevskii]
ASSSSLDTTNGESEPVPCRRGRRDRGRSRGRGRGGRCRGQGQTVRNAHDALRLLLLQKKNRIRFECYMKALSNSGYADIGDKILAHNEKENLLTAVEVHPGLMFNLLLLVVPHPGGYHPSPNSQKPSWCVCSNCQEMPTERENVCYMRQPPQCTTTWPDFELLVLDEAVLALARYYHRDISVLDDYDDINK